MSNSLTRWRAGLARSSKAAFGRLATLLGATEITDETWDELEALLLQADVGLETTDSLLKAVRASARERGLTRAADLRALLSAGLRAQLATPPALEFPARPSVILLVGANGAGKTTTAAKLGRRFIEEGKRVLLIAADTFRAAAVDQLQAWAEHLGLPLLSAQPRADPGAVVYDGIQSALAKGHDIVLVDTAGRLHSRHNLMEELKKICRVAAKALPGAPHAIWLVLDATTGQNALAQARAFQEAVGVNGVILAKLDTSARGGMAFAIQQTLGLPILFVGLGEQPADLMPFDPDAFVQNILEP